MDWLDLLLLAVAALSFLLAVFDTRVVVGRTINLVALGFLLVTLVALRDAWGAVF